VVTDKQISNVTYLITFTGTRAIIDNPFPPPYTAVNIIAAKLDTANGTHNCTLGSTTSTTSVVIHASAGVYRVTLIPGLPSEVVAVTGANP